MHDADAVRHAAYERLLASADDPSLIGLSGKRRGHRVSHTGDPWKARTVWQQWVSAWVLHQRAMNKTITLGSCAPAVRPITPPLRHPIPAPRTEAGFLHLWAAASVADTAGDHFLATMRFLQAAIEAPRRDSSDETLALERSFACLERMSGPYLSSTGGRA